LWEPGHRRWLVERRRIGPVIRAFEAATTHQEHDICTIYDRI
jgi:hypothetical protein